MPRSTVHSLTPVSATAPISVCAEDEEDRRLAEENRKAAEERKQRELERQQKLEAERKAREAERYASPSFTLQRRLVLTASVVACVGGSAQALSSLSLKGLGDAERQQRAAALEARRKDGTKTRVFGMDDDDESPAADVAEQMRLKVAAKLAASTAGSSSPPNTGAAYVAQPSLRCSFLSVAVVRWCAGAVGRLFAALLF